jgi:hypothetical protein
MGVQAHQQGLKLNGTHQLIVHAAGILGESIHTIKKNTEALVASGEEIGLQVDAEESKYMVTSRDQNAGQNHNIKIDNKSFERWKNSNIWEQP